MKKRYFSKKFGFTLIELMVVVVIIGILLALLLPRIIKTMDRSREKTTHKNLKSIKLALDIYCEKSDGGYDYPKSSETLTSILNEKFDNNIPRAVLRLGNDVPGPSSKCYVVGSIGAISAEGGWVFISNSGGVYINSTALDTNETPYTTYQCW